MITVHISKQSNYPVNTPQLKKLLQQFFNERGISSDADVSVALVGESQMYNLAKKYLKENHTLHNVLSFPYSEGGKEFRYPPDDILHLGDIIICFPEALRQAQEEDKLIEEKVAELAIHAGMHLLGIHHK